MRKLKRLVSLAISLSFLASLTSCTRTALTTSKITLNKASIASTSSTTTAMKKVVASNPNAKWTIAIYMAGDNDLYYSALDDINEMEGSLTPEAEKNINIIIMFDGKDLGDSKIYKITNDKNGYDDKIVSQPIDDKGLVIPQDKEVNTGDPEVFKKFVDFVTLNYPAQRNILTVWNHGGGIYRARYLVGDSIEQKPSMFSESGPFGLRSTFTTKNFASDYTSGNQLQLSNLKPALELGKKNLGKNFDIFGFDACLMATIETAYQVMDYADNFVASEEVEPGDGWDYVAYIGGLSKKLDITPKNLVSLIVKSYAVSYEVNGSQGITPNVTLSGVDLNKLKANVIPSLNTFANELQKDLITSKDKISKVKAKTETYSNSDSLDLGHFASLYNKETGSVSAKNLLSSYKDAVIASGHYGDSVKNASGLVIYFPTENYNQRYDDSNDIKFTETQAWTRFIKSFSSKSN